MTDVSHRPAKRAPRGPYRKSQATRDAILQAALEVFANEGFRKGSLRTIAAEVGMSQPGMLRHFSSKDELLGEVLHRNDTLPDDGDLTSTDGMSVLREMIRRVKRDMTRPGVVRLYCVVSAEATSDEHPAREYFIDRYRQLTSLLTTALEDIYSNGQLRDGVDPRTGAQDLIAVMDGARLQWLLDPESIDIGEHTRRFCVKNLLAASTPPPL